MEKSWKNMPKHCEDDIVIKQPTPEEFASVLDLRWRVLDEPVDCRQQTEPSETDRKPDIIHVAAFNGNTAISTVRIDPCPERGEHTVLVRRMATDPIYQRRGIGADVLSEGEKIARHRGAEHVILHARIGAIPFYETMGYRHNGRIEIHDGDENPEMEKDI
jgi:predicted N-acetyltransferase YhbS